MNADWPDIKLPPINLLVVAPAYYFYRQVNDAPQTIQTIMSKSAVTNDRS
jgi:hypothetical protein